jgi:hypothetical protein
MTQARTLVRAAAVLVAFGIATPAAAQFDPLHNHLKCYRIKDKAISRRLVLDNQFGRELVVKLQPQLLCLPTQKTCCQTVAGLAGCQPAPCDPDPVPPTPVHHFKCYKIAARLCANPACTAFLKPPKNLFVNLRDQFGIEQDVRVGPSQLLCAPVQKDVIGQTSTTTTSSTSTSSTQTTSSTSTTSTIPCRLDPTNPPTCGGPCPPGLICVNTPPGTTECDCVDQPLGCSLQTSGACGGLCPGVTQQCLPDTTGNCRCQP